MSRENYFKTHVGAAKQDMVDGEVFDPITLDAINLTGRNYISYLRLTPLRAPIITKYWDTNSAYNVFVNHPVRRGGQIVDPETLQPINPGFIERATLYKRSIDELGSTFEPTPHMMNSLFSKYLHQTITEREKLILRSFLFIEDDAILPKFTVQGLELRTETERILREHGNGAWLLRQSSVINSDLCSGTALSLMMENKIKHMIIIHVRGYGYYITTDITRGDTLPSIEDGKALPQLSVNNPVVYPCIVDILDFIFVNQKLEKNRFIYMAEVDRQAAVSHAKNEPILLLDFDRTLIETHSRGRPYTNWRREQNQFRIPEENIAMLNEQFLLYLSKNVNVVILTRCIDTEIKNLFDFLKSEGKVTFTTVLNPDLNSLSQTSITIIAPDVVTYTNNDSDEFWANWKRDKAIEVKRHYKNSPAVFIDDTQINVDVMARDVQSIVSKHVTPGNYIQTFTIINEFLSDPEQFQGKGKRKGKKSGARKGKKTGSRKGKNKR